METKNAKIAAAKTAAESTTAAKKRIREELAALVAREKEELAARRAVGIVGFYGRVPSVIDAFREYPANVPLTIEKLAELAERKFVASNPDRKVSANSSRLYSGEIAEAFRLIGLLSFDPKSDEYRITPTLAGLLTAKK